MPPLTVTWKKRWRVRPRPRPPSVRALQVEAGEKKMIAKLGRRVGSCRTIPFLGLIFERFCINIQLIEKQTKNIPGEAAECLTGSRKLAALASTAHSAQYYFFPVGILRPHLVEAAELSEHSLIARGSQDEGSHNNTTYYLCLFSVIAAFPPFAFPTHLASLAIPF